MKAPETRPVIALLTDFGTSDHYVGVMKGVIAQICPDANVVDLTHDVPEFSPVAGAFSLLASHRYFPSGTVFCCVVDPGVGTERDAVAIELDDGGAVSYLVCPDNGLATPLLPKATQAVSLSLGAIWAGGGRRQGSVSSTFHGRDIFAPAAARLAAGTTLPELGSGRHPDSLLRCEWPEPRRAGEGWEAEILHVDHFGNLVTNLPAAALTGRTDWRVAILGEEIAGISSSFGEVPAGALLAYIGSSNLLEIAVREGSAAASLGVVAGAKVFVKTHRAASS